MTVERPTSLFVPSRRRFLASCAIVGASALIGRFGHAQGRGHASPFTLGVASGDPWPDGFVLWTRLAPDPLAPDGSGGLAHPVQVFWEVAGDEDMRQIIQRGVTQADSTFGYSIHVDVSGLEPGRPFWYRFTALGEQSPVGRARTAPAPTDALAQLRFGFASCSHYELGYFSAYRHMATENFDLVLFLGDYIYEYTTSPATATVMPCIVPTRICRHCTRRHRVL
jgi:alkaline phosphatase D